ncbi:ribosome biogenesis protein WDR12 homolog [Onthophagus taurus]|uniref:ribosome biogenesis protein WDR12 homolog n=1 Tax=Onthophagus taurus TaxID=166361 RepID=UPI0039BE5045
MASSMLSEAQLQVKFITKQEQYAVPDVPFSVPTNIDVKSLNNLINKLLKEHSDFLKRLDFDFLVCGELLRTPLNEHLQERNVSIETTVEIEYLLRTPAPQPEDALLHEDWVSGIHVADKWVLTGCYDSTINLWTVKGNHTVSLKDHTNIVKAVSWVKENDPTGGFVSVSHDLTGILWHWEPGATPEIVSVLRGHERGIDTVGISPDTNRIATGGWDTHLKIWSTLQHDRNELRMEDEPPSKKTKGNSINQTPLHTLTGHKESISKALWLDNENICTVSMDHTIKIWDATLCGLKREMIGQKANLSASWSTLSNSLLVTSADRHIRLYDPRNAEGSVCKVTYTSHKSWVTCVAWSQYDQNLFMSGGHDECVKVWDTRSPNAPLYDLTGHEGKVLCVDWSNPKHLVSGGTDNSVHIFKNVHFNG